MKSDKALTKDKMIDKASKRRTTIMLSRDVLVDAKRFLADKGISMSQLVEDAITEKLRRDTEVVNA